MLGWWLPDNGSTQDVLQLVYWASGFALVVVQLALLRARPARARRQRAALREAVWAVVPALLLVWLGLQSHRNAVPEVAYDRQVALETSAASAGGER